MKDWFKNEFINIHDHINDAYVYMCIHVHIKQDIKQKNGESQNIFTNKIKQ